MKSTKHITDLIPYIAVTKENEMIEAGPCLFAKTYRIACDRLAEMPLDSLIQFLTGLLALAPPTMRLQFSSIKNPEGVFLTMTVSVPANDPEEAAAAFHSFHETAGLFCEKNGIPFLLECFSLAETLQLISDCYRPSSRRDVMEPLSGSELSSSGLRKIHLTTKDLVAPDSLSFGRNIVTTDGGCIRIYLISVYTSQVPAGLISQLTDSVQFSLTAVHFQYVNCERLLKELETALHEENGQISNPNHIPNRDQHIFTGMGFEESRMKETARAMVREAVSESKSIFRVSVYIGVHAGSEEELEKECTSFQKRIHDFSFCKVLPLDYLQKQGMTALLPLANQSLHADRMFLEDSAVLMLPLLRSDNGHRLFPLNGVHVKTDPFFPEVRMDKVKTGDTFKVKRSVQETIPYTSSYPYDGIVETVPGLYTRMYRFSDINYHTATEEDQTSYLIKYSQLLNRFDPSIRCQIILNNRNVDMQKFKEENLLIMRENDLDIYREEYNTIILTQMSEGRNNLKKERYMVIAVEAESFPAARHIFSRLDAEIVSAFKEIGNSAAEALSTEERLEILFDIYNIGNEGSFQMKLPEQNDCKELKEVGTESPVSASFLSMGITSKDLIVPSSFTFFRDYFLMGNKYCRILYLMDLPNTLSDRFVSDLASASCNLVISINLETVRQDKAVKMVKHQMLTINSTMQQAQQTASKNGYSMELVPLELRQAQEEANELLRNLTGRNQKMFRMTFTVLLIADSMEQLKTNTEILVTAGRKHLCNLKKLNYQQENGLNATLPYCLNRLSIKRTLTTDSTIIFTPFDTQELLQKQGMYYGRNAVSHNLILFNRDSSQNGNGWILGTPGSGKSFSAKREMAMVFLTTDDDILIIDPEREYSPLVKAFGGSIVRIAPGSRYHLNPLDMDRDYADDDDPIVLKSDFMLSLCESVIGGRYGLTPSQIAIIDRCVNMIYQAYIGRFDFDKAHTPTLLDFQHVLESQPEREARELAVAFEIYTKGSLDAFAHLSNVDISNRFVVYDIKDIGSNIKNMAYLVVLDNIWNRIVTNRKKGKRTWIYMDEVYILFEKEESTNFIRQIFSRGRKWGAKTTAITQNVEPILQNTIATTMLSNSAFIQLLNQAPVDRDILAALLHISPAQVAFINNAPPGQGLLYIQGQGVIPFRDHFNKQLAPNLYRVMTSKPDELMEEFR